MASGPQVGDRAPDFEAQNQDGETLRLSDFVGGYLVLYFYPKAFTPGCTAQSCSFRDRSGELKALGAQVLGMSRDPVSTLRDFADRYQLDFPLASDSDGSICESYGVKRMLVNAPRRITFLIDPQGVVAGRYHHELVMGKHAEEVLQTLKSRLA